MRRAIAAKFEQNRVLRSKLAGTGEEPLVHRSSTDDYWGANEEGVGRNRLGELLRELRAKLEMQRKT